MMINQTKKWWDKKRFEIKIVSRVWPKTCDKDNLNKIANLPEDCNGTVL